MRRDGKQWLLVEFCVRKFVSYCNYNSTQMKADDSLAPIKMVDSKRSRKGEQHGRARLTAADVLSIRKWAADNSANGHALPFTAKAREYNISEGSVRDIVERRTWRHLDDSSASCEVISSRSSCLSNRASTKLATSSKLNLKELTQEKLQGMVEIFLIGSDGIHPRLQDLVPGTDCKWRAIDRRLRQGELGESLSLTYWLNSNFPRQARPTQSKKTNVSVITARRLKQACATIQASASEVNGRKIATVKRLLANEHNVSVSSINAITRGDTWANLEGLVDLQTKPITSGIAGRKFGKLFVVRHVSAAEARNEQRTAGYWLAVCDCGNITRNKNAEHFTSGRAYSCGCSVRRPLGIGTGIKKKRRTSKDSGVSRP
jgi:hypothetical protein